jgi:outer membrane receptor protein involved in Fe transport
MKNMHLQKFRVAALFVIVLLVAFGAFAQTTGAIVGTVAQAGTALPGVTVEARSPNLQGARVETTDAGGHFRLSILPPGDYTVTATLSGFNTVTQKSVHVGLGSTVTLEVAMSPAASERITVTGAAPVVDVSSASTGVNVTSETMASLPIARNFTAVAQVAPGTKTDAAGTTVYGSTGAENEYVIDGLNTTAVRNGTEGKTLNFDFVQEVEVKTGGLPAEYGRMTGGMINAITKSGGNEFTGDVFGFDQPGGLRSSDASLAQRPFTAGSTTTDHSLLDYGLDSGGYFVKDRLWFFGAFDSTSQTRSNYRINSTLVIPPESDLPAGYTLPLGSVIPTKIKSQLFAGKLTLRATESQNLTLSIFGDPTKTSGALFGVNGPPTTTQGELKTGGSDYIGRYSGIFTTKFLVNAEAGHHHEDATTTGIGTTLPGLIDQTVSPNVLTGGFGFFDSDKYDRDVAKLSATAFLSNHEFKVGGDYEKMQADVKNFQGGAGQRIYKRLKNGTIYYRHRYYVDDLAPGFSQSDPTTWKIALPQVAQPETKNNSLYAQDSWRVLPNFTVSAGLRWESQKLLGRGGVVAADIKDNWAPRLGIIWDVANNGRSKAYANVGRFYENIPMDINIRSFGGELVCFCYNFSPNPANLAPDPAANVLARSSLLGGPTPVDPNLKGQYIDELLGGYEYEIRPNLAVGIKGTYRKLGRVIEDMLQVPIAGNYIITNPGTGIGRESGFYDFTNTVVAPKATRTYKGVEITANKRFSNNYQFFASYVWSRLEGNYDGTFQASTGQLDPNINSAYDYADFLVNNHGLLSNDRTHQLKFYGSYQFSGASLLNGLDVGLAAHYASGTPLTATGYSQAYQNWEYYLTTRGALGRGPADYEADFHVDYPVKVGTGHMSIIADVFNILDRQGKTAVDLRYNRAQDAPCLGFVGNSGAANPCNGDGGLTTPNHTLTPNGTVNLAAAPNPDFLKAGTQFTSPRSFRLGARFTF